MSGERRTKAQKVHAKVSTGGLSYSFSSGNPANGVVAASAQTKKTPTSHTHASLSMNHLFSYDVSLIYRDLAKTVVITVIMFCVLIGLSFII